MTSYRKGDIVIKDFDRVYQIINCSLKNNAIVVRLGTWSGGKYTPTKRDCKPIAADLEYYWWRHASRNLIDAVTHA